ncbi:DUF983 domain-containing protein [Zooshikella ganghwensis]|uniref:DUF983 domain-containing protein n=1 Tax=Zooshikella ganghwensis TaxID=202772 RepID=UPI00389A07F1
MLGIDCPECGVALQRENPKKYNWIFFLKAVVHSVLVFVVAFLYDQMQSKLVLGVFLTAIVTSIIFVCFRIIKGSKLRVQKKPYQTL